MKILAGQTVEVDRVALTFIIFTFLHFVSCLTAQSSIGNTNHLNFCMLASAEKYWGFQCIMSQVQQK